MENKRKTLPGELAKTVLFTTSEYLKGFNHLKRNLKEKGEDLILNNDAKSVQEAYCEYLSAIMYVIEQHLSSLYLKWKGKSDHAEEFLIFRDALFECIIIGYIQLFYHNETEEGLRSRDAYKNEFLEKYSNNCNVYKKYKMFPKKDEGFKNSFYWELGKKVSNILADGAEQLTIITYTQSSMMKTLPNLIKQFMLELTILENVK